MRLCQVHFSALFRGLRAAVVVLVTFAGCFMRLQAAAALLLTAGLLISCGDSSLEEISSSRSPEEIYHIAHDYINGYDHEINLEKAVILYSMAAERGYPPAEYMLANMYLTGSMVETDLRRATSLFIRAADHGIVEAQALLGRCLFENTGLQVDQETALKYLIMAARTDPASMTSLAYMHLTGNHVVKDTGKALALLNRAAEYKDPRALVILASIYINGDFGVQPDHYRGINLLQIAVAQPDNTDALIFFSQVYLEGKGVPQDEIRGLDYLRQAAEKDSPRAQYELGKYYWKKKNDYSKALNWIGKAAENGMLQAQEQLAYLYENGLGINQDLDNAIKWYERAAVRGSESAKYRLAVLLSRHRLDDQDSAGRIRELLGTLEHDAGSGDPVALRKLYYLYASSGRQEDREQAASYMKRIIDLGDMALLTSIARERFTGSVDLYADKPEAFRLMNIAAMAGYAPAQIQLADWYRAGEIRSGGEGDEASDGKDNIHAYVWYSLAADSDGSARSSRRNLRLKKDEIRQANDEILRLRKEIGRKQ